MEASNKIRLGIIGCGGMAAAHFKGYQELHDVMTVTATADIILERAQAGAEAAGASIAVTDYKELLPHVDAVLIVLPHDLHYEVGMTCLKAGKHVLMEKPMANSEQECLDLIATATERNLTLMTAYPVRFYPLIIRLKELIDSKAYGDVFQMSIWTEQFTKYEDGHWAHSAARLGGGQFFSHGCHYIDLMMWMLGSPVRGTHIGSNLGTEWMEKEGTSNVTLTFDSGAMGYHFGTWGARGSKNRYDIQVHCTGGMIEADITNNKLLAYSNLRHETAVHDDKPQIDLLMEVPEGGKYTHHEIMHFLECIRAGEVPLTNGPVSLQGLRVIWRLYEAEEKNVVADLRGLGFEDDWTPAGLDRLPSANV